MTTSILTLFTTYLIFPLIGLIMIGVAAEEDVLGMLWLTKIEIR